MPLVCDVIQLIIYRVRHIEFIRMFIIIIMMFNIFVVITNDYILYVICNKTFKIKVAVNIMTLYDFSTVRWLQFGYV